ncbi:hypothetical protein N7510_008476 [Penicillium lagena]|uniref:uncharacterized protein n=1 Tax=Penicillium lagena TaxID=94218 RepID=UPI0025421CE4|nr:uncharacterized protein N7510_008476 [Penicillium lagena]KAJ5605695.1 hypothetical protein N7510_008476 [Penicillium lagena]
MDENMESHKPNYFPSIPPGAHINPIYLAAPQQQQQPQHTTRAQVYNQEPWVESPSTGSRGSSSAGSQHAKKLTGLRYYRGDSQSQLLAAGTDHDGIKRKGLSLSNCGGWASFDDTWLLECLAMTFSVASFMAIIIILRICDQKPSPNLSYGLTLNTIVSLLAAASRSSLLFVVAAAVGQLKWIWFQRRERPVSDMQAFDDATRGPMGSLILLLQHQGLSLASLGAIVTIFAVALDPFVQQILSYPIRQTPSSTAQATMPQARTFAQNANYYSFVEYFNAALWNTDFAIDPTCPSGNCTWPEFQSLGFCSKCQDVTASASLYGCDQWTYANISADNEEASSSSNPQEIFCLINAGHGNNGSVPIEYFDTFRGTYIPTAVVWALNSPLNETFLGLESPLAVFAHAELEAEADTNITKLVRGLRIRSVQECILSLCLKTYNVSVSSGTSLVNVTSVDYGKRFTHKLPNNNEPYFNDLDCWRPTNRSGPFNWTKLPTKNWADTEQFAFCLRTSSTEYGETGFISLSTDLITPPFLGYSSVDYVVNESSVWTVQPSSGKNSADYGAAFDRVIDLGLGAVLSNMAAALTKYALETSNESAIGTAMLSQTFVAVSWQWLTFPSVLLVLGFVFWIATVVVNRRHRLGLWKSSILPMLYHGAEKVDPGLNSSGAEYTKISQMDESARTTHVKLVNITENRLLLGGNQ